MAAPPAAPQPGLYRFGVFEADARSGELRKNGVRLKLQQQPFQVMMELLRRPGEVVTREELRKALWPDDTFVDFDHGLNTAINKLRATLGDSGDNPRFIETLARRGYRFIATVTASGAPAAAAAAGTLLPAAGSEELPHPSLRLVRGLLALVQVMYLVFYLVALIKLGSAEREIARLAPRAAFPLLIVILLSAVTGIPIRLYVLSAVLFHYRRFSAKFRRLFPAVLVLDLLWALTPFLLAEKIGLGLAFAATSALLYLPFGQRTLVRMGYE